MRQSSWLLTLVLVCNALHAESPATVNNDDSCDVIVAPAATLLLPYFEVDLTRPDGETTLFTVANVTQVPQIAYVTIWTDWSFPVLSYNIFLTGYDVQSINVYDLLARGLLSGPDGTTSDDEWDVGDRSFDNDENPLLDIRNCDVLAVVIPQYYLREIQATFLTGRHHPFWGGGCPDRPVGGAHERAIGYVTIDVVSSCNTDFPTDPGYFTSQILFDNVLIGDYQQVSPQKGGSQGGPMVHIRAMPEGGGPGARPTNFTTTFYSSLQSGGTADRRQPLPATFAARWISTADGALKTSFKIWREGASRDGQGCDVAANSSLAIPDIVRFDEDENPVAFSDCPGCDASRSFLPATSNRSSDDGVFPPNPGEATAGWMYMNLNDQRMSRGFEVASQNWVVVSMEAEGGYSAGFDAASLGNGCTPRIPPTGSGDGDETVIAPAANLIKPAFTSGSPATINNDDSCDINVSPAATLLLPYFDVNPTERAKGTTFFTITNVTPLPQIARVTLWTDWAFPVLSFNLFLTGYDVQSIDLFDVIAHGRIAGGTTNRGIPGRRSEDNDANQMLDTSECGAAPMEQIPPNVLADVRRALTEGRTTACANARVGSTHANAIGYATIDVVQNCGSAMPVDAGYFTTQVLYDNVLIGDYQQVDGVHHSARGNTLVHLRAIPEGGLSGGTSTNFRRTFYSRLQNGGTADRRQPLPSTFAARWISGRDGSFGATFNLWREGRTNATAGCSVIPNDDIQFTDIVRFDEDENPTGFRPEPCGPCPLPQPSMPAVLRIDAEGTTPGLDLVPPNPDRAVAGWMYFNLDNSPGYVEPGAIALQNWIVVSMNSEDGRYSVDFDAASLGNGCSPPAPFTEEYGEAPAIGPAPNLNPERSPSP